MRISTISKSLLIAAFWLIVWQIISMIVGREVIVPSPYHTFLSMVHLLGTEGFYLDASATIFRCLVGSALSFIAGVLTAVASYRIPFVRSLLSFPVLLFKSTPVVAVILFLILCLASGEVPVFVCFLMCYPVVYTNILTGLDHLAQDDLEMVKMYGISAGAVLRYLYIPAVMPEISASLNLIAGLSWKTVVTAEVFAVPSHSMGYNLLLSKSFLETDALFAWVIAIVLLSMGFEMGVKQLIKRLSPKEYAGSKVLRHGSRKDVTQRVGGAAKTLTAFKLSKSFGEKKVLHGLDLQIKGGKITALMGPSGEGKTTCLRILAGLETADAGSVSGTEGAVISFLFQEDRLLPWLSLYDNLALVLKGRLPAEEIHKEIQKMLELLSLSGNESKLSAQLSGGMKRRVALARAFLYPADVLLLDEPFKGLDRALKGRIAPALFRKYARGKTVLLVTHDVEDAEAYAEETIWLPSIRG